jgi:hypothetical protein
MRLKVDKFYKITLSVKHGDNMVDFDSEDIDFRFVLKVSYKNEDA